MKELATALERSLKYYKAWLDGITPEHLSENLLGCPSINWILGHITKYRHLMARKLGWTEPEPEWAEPFDFGAKPGEPLQLTVPELIKELERITPELIERLRTLPSEKRDEKTEEGSTLGDELMFLYMHDAYHFGQISYIRSRLGYPSPFGNEE